VIREGEPGDFFYILTKGRAQVITRDASGKEIVLRELSAGGFFGELSMLTNEPRSARVTAMEDSFALALKRDDFLNFLRRDSNAAINIMIELGSRLHQNDAIIQRMVSRDVNKIDDERITLGQRFADWATDTIGSWTFIITQSILIVIWMALNVSAWIYHWDPYPFILLNLAFSFQSAYAGPVIMMSQNRQMAKDRLAAEINHQVNAKAEMEIGLLIKQVTGLEKIAEENQRELRKINKTQG
jgi:uncharacterized membrane protein